MTHSFPCIRTLILLGSILTGVASAELLFEEDFEAPAADWRRNTNGKAGLEIGQGGRTGNALIVVSEKGVAYLERDLPVEQLRGVTVTAQCWVKLEGVEIGPREYSTAKLRITQWIEGREKPRNHATRFVGTKDWHIQEASAAIDPKAVRVRVDLGLEHVTRGLARFDDLVVFDARQPDTDAILAEAAATGMRPFAAIATVGINDREETEWRGRFSLSSGRLLGVRQWRGNNERLFDPDVPFRLVTKRDIRRPKSLPLPAQIVVLGVTSDDGTLTVTTNHGSAGAAVKNLDAGMFQSSENGRISLERGAWSTVISGTADDDGEHDYPSACTLPDGGVAAVWQCYRDGQDELRLALRDRGGTWSPAMPVPGVRGDVVHPACAAVADGLLLVWSRAFNHAWDLQWCLRSNDGNWSTPKRLPGGAGSDLEVALAGDGSGGAFCVWQGFDEGSFEILMQRFEQGRWGDMQNLSRDTANDWRPAIAVDTSSGAAAVVWDSYRFGSYDIFAREIRDGVPGPLRTVSAKAEFEANATAAWDRQGRLWVAWEAGTENWGKDQGAVVPRPKPGTGLYRRRQIAMRILAGDTAHVPKSYPHELPGLRLRHLIEKPRLCVTGNGAVVLAFRACYQQVLAHPWGHGRFRTNRAWETGLTVLNGAKWQRTLFVPHHYGRLDSFPCVVPERGGGAALILHSDERTAANLRVPSQNRILAARLPAPTVAEPVLGEMPPAPPHDTGSDERAQTARIRDYRTQINGREHRIVRGDTHRHTEISWDGNGDGSIVDMFRYGIDAGALDFIMVSDHNQISGPDIEYVWWRTQKISDLYNNPPAFVTLHGYERSLGYPNGHRNVVNASRGHRPFPFTTRDDGKRGVAEDDTQQLYAYARKTNSIVISHTSGTRMGTDWRDNDPDLEPVVEIYQGARTSYEHEGAPKSATPGDRHATNSGYQAEGFVWRAWRKGLRLGVIASSDHGSTHISYASVYTPEATRDAIVESMRKRQTYGATDNIILEFRAGDAFMGQDVSTTDPLPFAIAVQGTAELTSLEIIKDFQFVYSADPDGDTTQLTWRDQRFGDKDESIYYVRVQQADGQIAWSSPIWVRGEDN